MYIQVNIGRNFVPDRFNPAGGTLSDLDWDEFKNDIVNNLVATVLTDSAVVSQEIWDNVLSQVEIHNGQGSYGGIPEESCHISLFVPVGLSEKSLGDFRSYLFNLKKKYSQGTIALLIGSELI